MPLSGIEQDGAPLSNQIEVCLFGKGFGECFTIHLGNNIWAIIDSFLHPKTNNPIALEYLKSLSVDIPQQIRLVVATHWHDDHIRGMSHIVEKANAARVVLSQVATREEFHKYIKRHKKLQTASGSKIDEMDKVLEFFANKPKNRLPPRFASSGKPLLELSQSETLLPNGCKIHALSPSDADVWDFMQMIAQMFPKAKKPKRPAKCITPNLASVVTRLDYDNAYLLFGADMENHKDSTKGWDAIVHADSTPPKAAVYKVAHHGSVTGHNEALWEQLLTASPLAIATPFINGRVKLPTVEQINAMLEKTHNLFATGLPLETKTKKRSAAVEKEIQNVKLRGIGSGLGAIRLRSMPITTTSGECIWSVSLFGHAQHLSVVHK